MNGNKKSSEASVEDKMLQKTDCATKMNPMIAYMYFSIKNVRRVSACLKLFRLQKNIVCVFGITNLVD